MRDRPAPRRVGDVPLLPRRDGHGHKGTFGRVLVVAGSRRYSGAAVLATRAAARSGCGLATLACTDALVPLVAPRLLGEILEPVPGRDDGDFDASSTAPVLAACEAADVVALGPGLTSADHALAFAREVASSCARPMVIDADGLNAFAGHAATLLDGPGARIITPHPGEAARLLDCAIDEVLADRGDCAYRLCRITGAVAVLKGAGTLVCDGRRLYENATGNSGLATGGSGDVLTGVIAALMAQGMRPFEAAALGVHLHGLAGDLAAERLGEHSVVAGDVLDFLPHAFRAVQAASGAPPVP